MSVGFAGSKEAFPACVMRNDSSAVNLPPDDQRACVTRKLMLKSRPSGHDLANRICAGKSERARITGGGERTHSEARKVADLLLRRVCYP